MLIDQIKNDLQIEVKKQDPLVLKTLRFMLSEINYAKIAKQAELTDEDVINVLTKEVKKRNEAIELFKKGGREDLVTEELIKLEVIKKYLPKQMPREEVEKIVEET